MILALTKLTVANLVHRKTESIFQIFTLAATVCVISILLQASGHLEQRLERDLKPVDLVVGASGSPLQLLLSSLLHVDVPNGNIPLNKAQRLMRDPMVTSVAPIALGDSFRGFPITGTTPAFLGFYKAELSNGRVWQKPNEAVIGASVAERLRLVIGQRFISAHGLSNTGTGHQTHDHAPFIVTGILEPTESVIDRLILTSVESIWLAHEVSDHEHTGGEQSHHHEAESGHEPADTEPTRSSRQIATMDPEGKEVTGLLITTKSPLALIRLPRLARSLGGMQASSPSMEIARLMTLSGGLATSLKFVLLLLIAIGLVGVFMSTGRAASQRASDLAVLRTLGARPGALVYQQLCECLFITVISAGLGIIAGHAALALAADLHTELRGIGLNGSVFFSTETWLFLSTCMVGVMAASLPMLWAYRADPVKLLQKGH